MVCGLAFAAIAHLHLFDASEDAVGRSMRYDIAWTGLNGRIEFALLEKHVARFAATGEKSDAETASLFYEIMRGRMKTWNSGGFKQFVEGSPAQVARFEKLRARIEALQDDMARLKEPDARRRILVALTEIGPIVERIGAEAHKSSVAESTAIRDALRRQQQLQRWLIFALLATGAAVLVFTVLQNRSLRAAHAEAARHAEDSLFLARHDGLTKLPNRSAFEGAYQAALAAKRADERILIAAIDLDGFKSVNDLLGHAAGDAVLVAVARLLVAEADKADRRNIVCRVGGDEFLALLWVPASAPDITDFAWRFLATLERPLETAYGTIMIGASVGVAACDSRAASDQIVNADLALTEAKARGKGIALPFDPGMLAGLKRRLRLEAELAMAIERGDFVPFYQPKVDLASQRISGLEVLARWKHPELGWISPAEFIPVAESSGAIVGIGQIMLDAACRDAALIPPDIGIAVNISVVQVLKDDIVRTVKAALASSGVDPARVTLEITESVMMSDPDKVIDTLKQLQGLGVGISLDDFGTGYSALSYLTQFAWDELKIDRGFIRRAWSDPINLTIIKAVTMLSRQMNAKITIEGVETPEQYHLLREIGCDTAQGFLFSPPVPLSELQPILLRNLAAMLAKHTASMDPAAALPAPRAGIAGE